MVFPQSLGGDADGEAQRERRLHGRVGMTGCPGPLPITGEHRQPALIQRVSSEGFRRHIRRYRLGLLGVVCTTDGFRFTGGANFAKDRDAVRLILFSAAFTVEPPGTSSGACHLVRLLAAGTGS